MIDWRRWVLETPDAEAVVWDGGSWSWADLSRVVDQWVEAVARKGLGAGHVVSLEARPDPRFVVALLSAWRVGAVAAPVYARLTPRERERQDRLLRPEWALDWEPDAASWSEDAPDDPLHRLRSPGDALSMEASWVEGPSAEAGQDPGSGSSAPSDAHAGWIPGAGARQGAVLLTTSGSTGEPRGLLLSHQALVASATATAERLHLSHRDRWGLLLSPAHAGGLSTVVRALALGGGLHVWEGPDAKGAAVTSIQEGAVSHLSVVPALAEALLDQGLQRPPPSFRCLLVGGAAVSPSLRRRAEEAGIPIALTWGMTETGGQVATAPPDEVAAGRDGVGFPLSGMDVLVARDGLLSVRGPFLASAVVDAPGGDLRPIAVDEDGWYATADVGRREADGGLRILGRVDEVIVTGGTNVHPMEVEDVLSRHPAIRAVGVVGRPDDRWGHVLVAGVVVGEERAPTEEALKAWCRDHLTRSRCPTHIVFLPELPRTPTGKVARRRLAALLA